MYYHLGKLIQPFLWPYSLGILCSLSALFFLGRSQIKAARNTLLLGTFFLLVPALPLVARTLMRSLESVYPSQEIADVAPADVIVVLGGSVLGLEPPRKYIQEADGSRVFGAWLLYRNSKSRHILVTSGVAYKTASGMVRTEAEDMKELLVGWGVPATAVVVEPKARNTDENARFASELIKYKGWNTVLLVTSAFHMPRSVALFQKYGVNNIQAFPTETRVTDRGLKFSDFMPALAAQSISTLVIKEYLGRWAYQ
jgi:uncharacterized SAM-binding protein YcdF (DUF218 family)